MTMSESHNVCACVWCIFVEWRGMRKYIYKKNKLSYLLWLYDGNYLMIVSLTLSHTYFTERTQHCKWNVNRHSELNSKQEITPKIKRFNKLHRTLGPSIVMDGNGCAVHVCVSERTAKLDARRWEWKHDVRLMILLVLGGENFLHYANTYTIRFLLDFGRFRRGSFASFHFNYATENFHADPDQYHVKFNGTKNPFQLKLSPNTIISSVIVVESSLFQPFEFEKHK